MAEFKVDYEVLELAIAREVEACNFYLALAERTENPQIQDVLKELAGEELEHKAKLELEVIKTGMVVRPQDAISEITDEVFAEAIRFDVVMDYKDLLLMCIQKEEAAFRLYVDLASRITDTDSRDTLLAIAGQEVKHKIRFETEYDNLLKGI